MRIEHGRFQDLPGGMQGQLSERTGQGATMTVGVVPMCSTVRNSLPLAAS